MVIPFQFKSAALPLPLLLDTPLHLLMNSCMSRGERGPQLIATYFSVQSTQLYGLRKCLNPMLTIENRI